MEDQLVHVLANTQLPAEGPRKQAELDLKHAARNPAYPLSLANIARHSPISLQIRQAALTTLRLFIQDNWSENSSDGPTIPISDAVKDQVRPMILDLALNSEDKKIRTAASFTVGKIANVDFPDQWGSLLPALLDIIPNGHDNQLHGALIVLRDLVDDSLSGDQFFSMARDIVKAMYDAAVDENRKPALRALAVRVFVYCFDLLDTLREDHGTEVQAFTEEAMKGWFPLLRQFLGLQLPGLPEQESQFTSQPDSWCGIIALKLQAVKCLLKLKNVFPSILSPEMLGFFQMIWEELLLLEPLHAQLYIENEAQGRLEDSDGLPYSLDFLILEELDFLNISMGAPPVRKELKAQLAAHPSAYETPWVLNLMKLASSYARITREEEELWDIDVSLYLVEEQSVSSNYTPRTACGDLLIKLGEWLNQKALEGLFAYTKSLFTEDASWRKQEAALYLLNMLANDFLDCNKTVPPEVSQAYLELVNYAVSQPAEPLLRARGYLVAGILAHFDGSAAALMDRAIEAITAEESDLVQVACIKAVEGFLQSESVAGNHQLQAKVVNAISQWVAAKDMTEIEEAEDLLVTLTEALRAAIGIDRRVAVSNDVPALDLLFLIAKHGSTNWQVTMLICEEFEEIVKAMPDPASFRALCEKVLPSLTGAFSVADVTSEDALVTFATELMAALTQYASEPLPPGFVAATLPKLSRLLMETNDGDILRPSAESVKYLLAHDHEQVLNYHDENNRSGVEVCLRIIDRLLGPAIEDNAASEVGGLAAELVEKAGHERLGPFLPQLLQAVANRLATAEAASFIQSLILVFARLSLVGAHDVVEFLSTIQINGQSGLQVVLSKWLENSVNFAGYDEIRQNVIALSKLYSLNDPRVGQTMVRGDFIMPASDRIMTRSRTRQQPDQYTIIPAPLKILKVLVEELLSASGANSAAVAAAAAAAEFADDDGDNDWEDDPNSLDLSIGTSKNDLMSFLEASNIRHRDDETQAYLTEFFLTAARDNIAGFGEWYNQLTEDEKAKLNELSQAQQ
ncbi:ARM repeat-containing protein [Hypomontagnella submonticulosa]|nr:ARM repeat-containing protein [Hypomontagnella submonticulosa]